MKVMKIKDMNVEILLDGSFTSIVGPTNSGKTTVLKKLINQVDNKDIFIDDVNITEYDINYLRNNIVVVLDDDIFNDEFVAGELYYNLSLLGYRIDEITKKIDNIAKIFDISDLMSERIESLPVSKKMLIKLLSYLIIEPKIIGIDEILSYMNNKDIVKVLKFIQDHGITLINATNNEEHLLLCDNIIIMNNYKCVMSGSTRSILSGNSILPYMGLRLPFIIELSHNLILYDLIKEVYYTDRELIDRIWK